MEIEEYFKDEDDTVYKTVVNVDGTMEPFVFQHKTNVWVNAPIGHLMQVQWNGHKISKDEAEKIIGRQVNEKI